MIDTQGPKLLQTAATVEYVRDILAKKGDALLGVAYWGKGAASQLGLEKRNGKTRIICDLWSGLCNPDEIKKLLKGGVEMRTRDRFHAKVYCISDRVVIGSSNASTNGLGFEGLEAKHNVELSVAIAGNTFASNVRAWFEVEWIKAEPVDSDMAEDARPFWDASQRNRPTQTSETILQALAAENSSILNAPIWIGAYIPMEPDPTTKKAYRTEGEGQFTAQELEASGDYYPYYVDRLAQLPHFELRSAGKPAENLGGSVSRLNCGAKY